MDNITPSSGQCPCEGSLCYQLARRCLVEGWTQFSTVAQLDGCPGATLAELTQDWTGLDCLAFCTQLETTKARWGGRSIDPLSLLIESGFPFLEHVLVFNSYQHNHSETSMSTYSGQLIQELVSQLLCKIKCSPLPYSLINTCFSSYQLLAGLVHLSGTGAVLSNN